VNGDMAEWFHRYFSGLYTQVLGKQFAETQTLKQARLVKRLLRLRRGQRVLDIPCGQGRLTIALAQMGLVMTGVDLAEGFLRRARRRARKKGLDLRFVHGDMRDIAFDGEFDAAFNWFTSIGYFSDEDNLAFCSKVFQALRPGGRFLVETMNRSWMVLHFGQRLEQTIAGVSVVHRNRWDARRRRILASVTFRKGKAREHKWISVRFYTGPELRSMLRAAGFRDIVLYGNPPPGRLTRHSRRLIAVGRKPHNREV
jgi:2-polyprenyl-3-methyl-5-hydroxy-6-metoxy-1,4-benzoquinol methylase